MSAEATPALPDDLLCYPPCMSIAQCAEFLGRNADSLRDLWRQGKFPGRKVGARIIVPRVRLWAWLNESETREEPEAIRLYGRRDRAA